jgi:hypothetical protein
MAKRRKVIPVTLTDEQRERLEHLWFYYGNYGPRTTPGNHSFIQRLLENGIDERPLYTKRTPKSEIPTPECEAAVEAILARKKNSGSSGEEDGARGGLRIISSAEERSRPVIDPEMKAMLDDMKHRRNAMNVRHESDDDKPDAA